MPAQKEKANGQILLQVENLSTVFPLRRGMVKAVQNLSLELREGQILGVVGESGSGKSVTMLSILRLVPHPGRIVSGRVLYRGRNLLELSEREMRSIRGREIAMIFQDPMTTLNPAFRIGEQIAESLRIHGMLPNSRLPGFLDRKRKEAERRRVIELLEEVGIPIPEESRKRYPHEFSGGMQQRALIAIALACRPKVLLADEPTTALDVTIQAQIMDLLRKINREHGTGIILVTHDLGLAAEFCQEIAVMYAGRIMERGPVEVIVGEPKHPYTRGLLACLPQIGRKERLKPIPGTVPDLANLPPGCPFYPRCEERQERCQEGEIPLVALAPNHHVRCVLYKDTD